MTTSHGKSAVRLLLADDNPMVRDLIVKGLEPFCEVEVCKDGADALLKVVDSPPDVILSDYKMPILDGRQLFEKLRARDSTRHIPFLFMASRPDIEERLRPLVDGVEDFITKPFLVKDLVRIAKKVIDRLHLEKQAVDDFFRDSHKVLHQEGLGDEILNAVHQRPQTLFNVRAAGHKKKRNVARRVARAQLFEELSSIQYGHFVIGKNDVRGRVNHFE